MLSEVCAIYFAYHIITNLEFLGGPTNGIQKVSSVAHHAGEEGHGEAAEGVAQDHIEEAHDHVPHRADEQRPLPAVVVAPAAHRRVDQEGADLAGGQTLLCC